MFIFSGANSAAEKHVKFAYRKHRVLIALFHFVAKVRQFVNPRLLIKAAVVEFIGRFFHNVILIASISVVLFVRRV